MLKRVLLLKSQLRYVFGVGYLCNQGNMQASAATPTFPHGYRFLRFRLVRMMSPDRRICMVKAGDPSGCLRSCLRVPQCLSIPQVNGRPRNIKERQRSLRATM
jgi:hypothetical protein